MDTNEYEVWLHELEASKPFGPHDRIGTLNHINEAARLRAAGSVQLGKLLSLARPVRPDRSRFGADASVELVTDVSATAAVRRLIGMDRFSSECHGLMNTHLDALNHFGVDDRFYGGFGFDDPQLATISDFARAGVFTRAVVADIPSVRGTGWVEIGNPVTGDEIDAALSGVTVEPGDALLLYMGRDEYERAGHDDYIGTPPDDPRPGLGPEGARWLADHSISILGWDFLDATDDNVAPLSVHKLIWAIGLAIIDNCLLGEAARACAAAGRRTGALSVAPVATDGTGCLVNPLFVM